MASTEMWVERHRPRSVSEMKGQATIVDRLRAYASQRDFPHLLFAGPPGTGKTTAALALARDVFLPCETCTNVTVVRTRRRVGVLLCGVTRHRRSDTRLRCYLAAFL